MFIFDVVSRTCVHRVRINIINQYKTTDRNECSEGMFKKMDDREKTTLQFKQNVTKT